MPKELKQRMQDYFQTMWSLNHGIDIYEVKFTITLSFKFFPTLQHNFPDFERVSRGIAWRCVDAFASWNSAVANIWIGVTGELNHANLVKRWSERRFERRSGYSWLIDWFNHSVALHASSFIFSYFAPPLEIFTVFNQINIRARFGTSDGFCGEEKKQNSMSHLHSSNVGHVFLFPYSLAFPMPGFAHAIVWYWMSTFLFTEAQHHQNHAKTHNMRAPRALHLFFIPAVSLTRALT